MCGKEKDMEELKKEARRKLDNVYGEIQELVPILKKFSKKTSYSLITIVIVLAVIGVTMVLGPWVTACNKAIFGTAFYRNFNKIFKVAFAISVVSLILIEAVEKNGILKTGFMVLAILVMLKAISIMMGVEADVIDTILKYIAETPNMLKNWFVLEDFL